VTANTSNLGLGKPAASAWQARYASRHRYVRLADAPGLPNGRRGRVTIYHRGQDKDSSRQSFILSWCHGGKRVKERVVGDQFDAVRRADEIIEALRTGPPRRPAPLGLGQLAARYIEHLERRAEAGEISPSTPARYRSALQHFVEFATEVGTPSSAKAWVPSRELVLRFKAYLRGKLISPNGHAHTSKRMLSSTGVAFIVAAARALVHWAIAESLLAAAASDAFVHAVKERHARHALSATPIEAADIIKLIEVADPYQLALFSFHIFHGVRVAEPCWTMIEFMDAAGGWIDYRCVDELGYRTKGGVNKRLPLPAPMADALVRLVGGRPGGPLLLKRRVTQGGRARAPSAITLRDIIATVQKHPSTGWAQRARVAAEHIKQLGAIDGDVVRREFAVLVRRAGLRSDLTPKSLRHHFATALERADVPYYTRKYLLGHNLGDKGRRGADVTAIYTHLEPEFIKAAYQRLLDGPLAAVLGAFTRRARAHINSCVLVARLSAAERTPLDTHRGCAPATSHPRPRRNRPTHQAQRAGAPKPGPLTSSESSRAHQSILFAGAQLSQPA
jgi:integrase